MRTYHILGDAPESRTKKVLRSLCLFVFGAFLGLFPAMFAFSLITIAPHASITKLVLFLLLIFCVPLGLLFVLLGLFGQGRVDNCY